MKVSKFFLAFLKSAIYDTTSLIMRILDLLIITAFVVLWYGIAPLAGALVARRVRRSFVSLFRKSLDAPILDYGAARRAERLADGASGGAFRFWGAFESLSDDTVWGQSDSLLVPIATRDTRGFFLHDGVLERIRWSHLPALPADTGVFVAGETLVRRGRLMFEPTKKTPLVFVLYAPFESDNPHSVKSFCAQESPLLDAVQDTLLKKMVVVCGGRNDYRNAVTPYSLIIGAFCLTALSVSLLNRPELRTAAACAFAAAFIPLFPLFPPGLLLTHVGRFLRKRAEDTGIHAALLSLKDARPIHGSMQAAVCEAASWVCIVAAVAVNVFFIAVLALIFFR